MPYYNLTKNQKKAHLKKHRQGITIKNQENYCNLCYPVDRIPVDNIPNGFHLFWLWISVHHTAEQYTGATIAAFKILTEEFYIATELDIIVNTTTSIVKSIKYQEITIPFLELSFYLHKLFELTNGFQSLPTAEQIVTAHQIFHNTQPIPNLNMAITNDQMKALLDGVFGAGGVDWKTALTNVHNEAQATNAALTALRTATTNRATKIVEVPPFYGNDTEDPNEWIDIFIQAHTTNGWADDRRVALAAGHLKEAAYDWYQNDKTNITQWEGNPANSFKERLIAYFATPARKNQWARELQGVKQKEGESMEDYSRRFRKLLNRATTGNVLADQHQVNYFINGLSPIYVSQVVLASPATLAAAIERAKLVESGVKYTLLNVMPKEEAPIPSTSQSVVAPAPVPPPVTQVENSLKNELDALTKQMQQLSINYANLSASVTRTPRFNQSNNRTPRPENINRPRNKREVTCFKCGKLGHYARECTALGNRRPNQVQFQSNRNNQRPVNFMDYEEECYETDEYEEYDEEFETEIYAFKRKEPYQREVRET
ncbi:hypothetical protein RCL_jg8074.t1 [Rhizophagus clarus]|uniref:CCHC-type domain-containing protein n=1 Tax=Rhizophagus clarus TaxID=94130 RepID=A0A8H3R6G0_9GLOM|nr:hypothetical protein RCL_jg8074.t1 [Rhizophagus clarus]